MHITVSSDGSLGLDMPDDFTAFDIRAADPSSSAVLAALGGAGSAAPEDDHAFVAIDEVRRLAGDAADEVWENGFSGMIDYAGSKGWLDRSGGSIKAHIEPA